MTANADLAASARQLAAAAPNGSLERKAYGCAAAVLATTGTLAAARRALDDVGQVDVQAAALAVLEQLAGGRKSATMTGKAAAMANLGGHGKTVGEFRAQCLGDRQAAVDALVLEAVDVLARGLLGEDWRRRYGRSPRTGEWTARPRRVA